MIESKDNAENKIYHVISAAILKNANLGIFPKEMFGKLVFSCKIHDQMISNLYRVIWFSGAGVESVPA